MYYVFRVDVWTGAEGSERVRVGFCVPLVEAQTGLPRRSMDGGRRY
jgi:hypothetical protein